MLDDIFAVQDDIARSVVQELRTTLLGGEPDSKAGAAARADVAAAVRGRGEGGEAYRLLLQGRYFVSRSTRDNLLKGIGTLREAVQMDPNLALAWAELAGAYAIEAGYGWGPVDEGHDQARRAAERALALEPNLAEGHVRLGSIQMNYDRDWRAAERSIRRALELAPGNAIVLRLAGNLTSNLGRLEEAIELYRRAVDQDPLSPAGYQSLGICCLAAGRLSEAEEAFRTSSELGPQRIGTHSGFALVLLEQGRGEEALAAAEREPEPVFQLMTSAIVLHAIGRRRESDVRLGELIEKYAEGGAYQISEVYAARGEADAAFEWLERAYEQRDGGLVEMKTEPSFRSVREDPRWTGVPEVHEAGVGERPTSRGRSAGAPRPTSAARASSSVSRTRSSLRLNIGVPRPTTRGFKPMRTSSTRPLHPGRLRLQRSTSSFPLRQNPSPSASSV
jgi:tetratricopeptide (TPR) repeat protein